ncbi:hypothetical protein V1514DRAFT_329039 [Lipomyces japonicus]|uniref:uncharacterized protein n=1 Tax=Lipomyces japonicus TaxID=56871 RepID=UPI0034CDD63C
MSACRRLYRIGHEVNHRCKLRLPLPARRLFQVRTYSDITPSRPDPEYQSSAFRTGQFAPVIYHSSELDPDTHSIARAPIYTASSAFHVSATKRVSWAIALLGGYFSAAMLGMDGIPAAMSLLIGVPTIMPLPIVNWLTTPYVTRIYRIYPVKEDAPVTASQVEHDEEFMFECISLFGRQVYNCRVKLSDLRVVHKRFGWVNIEVVSDSVEKQLGRKQNIIEKALDGNRPRRWFYVADDVGGYKMDRIWAIIDRQSGIDNGRYEK